LVKWSTGVKALVTLAPGETGAEARALLIATYRSADAGYLGSLSVEASRG
jgi:hypothetical protein